MITLYWGLQYAAVLCSYVFLLFVWPRVVFHRHLTGKGRLYQFSFCTTVQMVLINTVVLVFGLVHILNRWTIMVFFFGIFLAVIMRRYHINGQFVHKKIEGIRYLVTGAYGKRRIGLQGIRHLGSALKRARNGLWAILKPHLGEYTVLALLLVFGMTYFSYGAFQHYFYGFGDMYTHHSWIQGLTEGKIFSAGVYPEGMHCFVFSLHALFGIEVYSILLFLGGIQVSVLLIALYALLRGIFHWRYTPFFVIMLFLVLDVCCVDEVYSMSRLQGALPQEFGMYAQFLCVLYLLRFLKSTRRITRKEGKLSKFYWDENLFLFTMAFAVTIIIHFYITIITFFLCFSFVIFALRKVFCPKRIVPLLAAVLCGILIAGLPMAGALASGIPFQGSIGWAMNVINGTDTDGGRTQKAEQTKAEDAKAAEKTSETSSVKRYADKMLHLFQEKAKIVYKEGYKALYGKERTWWILTLTAFAAALWLLYRLAVIPLGRFSKINVNKSCFDGYPGVVFSSLLFMVIYAAPFLRLPELIAGVRVCLTEQMMILAVLAMPVDMVFSLLAIPRRTWWQHFLQVASILCTGGIYAAAMLLGVYHGFLYYEMTRYNASVMTTNSIIREMPPNTYTVISPTDELYALINYGWHEELSLFIEKTRKEEYILPTEYIFLYVEKKPVHYAQFHFCEGPSWLASEKYAEIYSFVSSSQCPDVKASVISQKAAERDLEVSGWYAYADLESRTILESKAYQWCKRFSQLYPSELKTYYEDEDFVCYYFRQEPNSPYNLAIK